MPSNVTTNGLQTTQCTPTSLTVIKPGAGYLGNILVSAANGTTPILVYDNASAASGTVIGAIAASATPGTVVDCQMPARNGITIAATTNAGTITVCWS